MSSGSRSHECRRSSQTDLVGAGKEGSANAPTGTATTPGEASVVKNTVAPQSGQKWKTPFPPPSETRMYCREVPWVVTTQPTAIESRHAAGGAARAQGRRLR